MLVVGIIPPFDKEPCLNTFLEPLVKEMKVLWKGVKLKVHGKEEPEKIKAAILCASSDIPASRKLCGFLGHNATFGCNKCLKTFPRRTPGSLAKDYSGFDKRAEWSRRTNEGDRRRANQTFTAKCRTEKDDMETLLGARFNYITFGPSIF